MRSKTIVNFCKIAFFTMVLIGSVWQISAQTNRKISKPKIQTATIIVNQYDYQPSSLRLRQGIPARVKFIRRSDKTCGTEIVFPDYGIRRELPLNETVVIAFTPRKKGEFAFVCGMNMMRGKVIVQ
jgi:plastocyanin domain-containing protein